jgi:hypothetical protein
MTFQKLEIVRLLVRSLPLVLYVSGASITCSSYEPLNGSITSSCSLRFLLIALLSCSALHDLWPPRSSIFYHLITMPTEDASPTTTIVPDLSNGMSKDAIIEDLRRRLEESELSSNAGSSSGGWRRRRSRKPKNGLAPSLAATAAPILPRLSTTMATTTKKTKTKETKPVRLQIGLNLDLELELKARIQGDISLSLV